MTEWIKRKSTVVEWGPPHHYWFQAGMGYVNVTQLLNSTTYNVSESHVIKGHISGPYPTLEAAQAACILLNACLAL